MVKVQTLDPDCLGSNLRCAIQLASYFRFLEKWKSVSNFLLGLFWGLNELLYRKVHSILTLYKYFLLLSCSLNLSLNYSEFSHGVSFPTKPRPHPLACCQVLLLPISAALSVTPLYSNQREWFPFLDSLLAFKVWLCFPSGKYLLSFSELLDNLVSVL